MHLRCSAEGAFMRVLADGREGVRNDGNEKVDEPEVQHDDAHNEKEAGDEELRVHHVVHQRRPLPEVSIWNVCKHRYTYAVRGRHDEDLQCSVVDRVEIFHSALWVPGPFLHNI